MSKEIDIVYPLGSGSRWQNNEIRYSLRSVEKHLKGVRNVYIVGQKPLWLGNLIHIPADDPLNYNADGNIAMKVLKVCEIEDLSDDFLFINDDHIFLKDIQASEIPNYYKFDLVKKSEKYFEGGLYVQRLKRTRDILKKRKLPTLHFDCHTPIILNKKKFPEVIEYFAYRDGIGYTMKSLYANFLRLEGVHRPDLNIKSPSTLSAITQATEGETIMAFNDRGLSGDLKKFLQIKFPNKSKYEIMEKDKQILYTEAINWLEAENKTYSKAHYDEGVRIYCDLGRNRHLMGMVKRTRNERYMRAITRELKVITQKMKSEGMKPAKPKKEWKKPEITSKPAAKKSGRVKINTNDYVDPNALPSNLREKFEENQELTRTLSGMHTELSQIPKGEANNPRRQQLANEIVTLEKKRDANWKAIDTWWKDKDKDFQPQKASGSYTKEEIERIKDPVLKAKSKELRITANKRYIDRYASSLKEKQKEKVKLRKRELEEWEAED